LQLTFIILIFLLFQRKVLQRFLNLFIKNSFSKFLFKILFQNFVLIIQPTKNQLIDIGFDLTDKYDY